MVRGERPGGCVPDPLDGLADEELRVRNVGANVQRVPPRGEAQIVAGISPKGGAERLSSVADVHPHEIDGMPSDIFLADESSKA